MRSKLAHITIIISYYYDIIIEALCDIYDLSNGCQPPPIIKYIIILNIFPYLTHIFTHLTHWTFKTFQPISQTHCHPDQLYWIETESTKQNKQDVPDFTYRWVVSIFADEKATRSNTCETRYSIADKLLSWRVYYCERNCCKWYLTA